MRKVEAAEEVEGAEEAVAGVDREGAPGAVSLNAGLMQPVYRVAIRAKESEAL